MYSYLSRWKPYARSRGISMIVPSLPSRSKLPISRLSFLIYRPPWLLFALGRCLQLSKKMSEDQLKKLDDLTAKYANGGSPTAFVNSAAQLVGQVRACVRVSQEIVFTGNGSAFDTRGSSDFYLVLSPS